jgi:ABC-type Fe3+-hydroxamate transport system substrate-binding protein
MVDLPVQPQRIVSLVSGLTEALFAMGCGDRVAGVSTYCSRYVPNLAAPVVGDYLMIDDAKLREVQPDLVLTTTGIQRGVGKRLSGAGFPVYALPLPNSLPGILENVITLGGLLDQVPAARDLSARWQAQAQALRAQAPSPRPRVYAELWLGRHMRTPGGLSFIHDLIDIAGGDNLFGDEREPYLSLDPEAAAQRRPDSVIVFSEPDYPVEAHVLLEQRGWLRTMPNLRVIQADVRRGYNMIHDGPSMLETAAWLQSEFKK